MEAKQLWEVVDKIHELYAAESEAERAMVKDYVFDVLNAQVRKVQARDTFHAIAGALSAKASENVLERGENFPIIDERDAFKIAMNTRAL